MRQIKGILFDFDGTLARTMEDNLAAWRAVISDYGFCLQPEDYYQLEGLRLEEVAAALFRKQKLTVPDVRELARLKDEHYLKNHRFSFYPGVEVLVDLLELSRIPMGIVTAGVQERLRKSVPAPFLMKFQSIVTCDMTLRGKPHPDPYLRGAKELQLNPEDCLVIENAPLGIKAAKSANAYCIAICSTLRRALLDDADEIVSSFEDLLDLPIIQGLLVESYR